MEDNEY